MNIFFGWTGICWLVALIDAFQTTKPVKKENLKIEEKLGEMEETLKDMAKDSNNKYENLQRLHNLKESGAITENEFETEKKKILEK